MSSFIPSITSFVIKYHYYYHYYYCNFSRAEQILIYEVGREI